MVENNSSKKNHVPNDRLREAREQRGWAHKDVAEFIDLPDAHTVGRWERGVSFPRPYYRQRLCQLFGKSAEELGLLKEKSGVNKQPSLLSENKQPSPYIWKIPPSFTSFVGREQEIVAVRALLEHGDTRLVTLLGPGGVGKTRLSIQIASELRDHFVDGACFVSLAAISDPRLVLPTIAQELGVLVNGAQSIIEQVKSALCDRYFLLVLDNFEQVLAAATLVEELLAGCQGLKVLVTSRAVLHIQAEQEFAVAPLALPNLDKLPIPGVLLQCASVALFVQRAQALLPTFELTQRNAQAIAEICQRLDGLPLAIELAAARIKLLPPQALFARLSQGLQVLKSEQQAIPKRQQTLYNTIRWSYDLLDDRERWLFRHLSIFAGGCTLEAAEAIFSNYGWSALEILNSIASLIDKSLLQQIERDGDTPRFVMLETLREYGLDFLQDHGEREGIQRVEAMYYLALVEEAGPQLKGAQQAKWLALLEQEKENLRIALTWLIQHEETEAALRFSEAFGKFCGLRGYWTEEQHWLSAVLELPWATSSMAIRARVLRRAGHLAYRLRDLVLACALQEESVELSRKLGDKQNLAGALNGLAWALYRQKNIALASRLLQESVEAARESGDKWAIANSLESLGRLMHFQGYTGEACLLLDESLVLARELADKENLARILTTLVSIEISQGNITRAAALARESFTLAQELGTKPLIALVLESMGDVSLFLGEYERAAKLFEEHLVLAWELGDRPTIAKKRLHLGDCALVQGDLVQATTFVQESLKFFRGQDDNPNIAAALSVLGDIKRAENDLAQAMALYKEALLLDKELGKKKDTGRGLIGLAMVALKLGLPEQAVSLFGFAESYLVPQRDMHPAQRLQYESAVENAHARLGEKNFVTIWSRGNTMSFEEAFALMP